jgi:hypothetical protein
LESDEWPVKQGFQQRRHPFEDILPGLIPAQLPWADPLSGAGGVHQVNFVATLTIGDEGDLIAAIEEFPNRKGAEGHA